MRNYEAERTPAVGDVWCRQYERWDTVKVLRVHGSCVHVQHAKRERTIPLDVLREGYRLVKRAGRAVHDVS